LVVGPSLQVECRFENSAVDRGRRGPEVISQFHPLVRFASAGLQKREGLPQLAVAAELLSTDAPASLDPGEYLFAAQRWSISGLQDREKLYLSARSLGEPGRAIAPEIAEQLVLAAANHGSDWRGAAQQVDLALAEAIVNHECLLESDEAFDRYVAELQAENEDRTLVQLRALAIRFGSQMENLEVVRQRHLANGRMALAKATEGRERALEGRVEKRRHELERRRQTSYRKDEICVGLIRVLPQAAQS
jgi:cytidylate kinase